MSEDIWKNIPEEDRRRIEGNWSYSYQLVAIDECEYWQPKLKERDAMIELLQRQRQELVDKLNELSNPERDELFVKDLKELREKLIGKCQPWVFCCTSIDNEIKDLLTRYSNLKAK